MFIVLFSAAGKKKVVFKRFEKKIQKLNDYLSSLLAFVSTGPQYALQARASSTSYTKSV